MGPLVPLLLEQFLASFAPLELSFPRFDFAVHFLDFSHELCDVVRHLRREILELVAGFLNLLFEGFHLDTERLAELVQDVIVDLVVLVVHLGLHGAVLDF